MQVERQTSLEHALARIEADAEATLKVATTVVSYIKKFRDAAKTGNLRELNKAMKAVEQAVTALRQHFTNAKESCDFDWETYFSGSSFHSEILQAARQAGAKIFDRDGMIYCYPRLIRILAKERTIQIDKVIERRVRPSFLARHLKELQNRPVRFNSQAFLECLYEAYSRLLSQQLEEALASGRVIKFTEIYHLLTLLPGQSKDYSKEEFARDIYMLDKSGVTKTNQGLVMKLVPPSTAGKDSPKNSLRVISEEGTEKPYYGISFNRP